MEKHPEIEQALIYKTGMINKTSSKIIEPKTWKTEYDLLKKKNVVAKNTYMNASEEIEIFSNILKKITQVNKSKVAEKELILSAVDFPSSPCKDGYYRLNVKDPSRKSGR